MSHESQSDRNGFLLAKPLVSVIVVGHNQAKFIEEAIASALAQTYDPKEIIFVDDGSTDDTADVVALHSDIRYLKQSNQGLSAARNAGLAASRGKFTVFLDGDDRLLPVALESGVKCFTAFPQSAFVFGQYRGIDATGKPLPAHRDMGILDDYYLHLLSGNFIGMHATVMYSRERLEKIGGFDTALEAAEDYEVYLRMAREQPITQHGELVAEYRTHADNMSSNPALMLRSVLRVCDRELEYLRDPRQRAALQAGRKFYKGYYGEKMIHAWKGRKDARGLRTLLRSVPSVAYRRALRSLAGRLASSDGAERINFGSLRRLTPVSRQFGFERGQPVDRRYIEFFLNGYSSDIQGTVLEIGDDTYSRRFGRSRVVRQEVLHVTRNNPLATIVANLENAPQIDSEQFDCVICTQTLHLIYDFRAAVATLHRILKSNGVLLMTVPGISQICHDGSYPDSDSWRFTKRSMAHLVKEIFVNGTVDVRAYGNVLAASSFLYGIATRELSPEELDFCDEDYPVVICVHACKAGRNERAS